MEQGKGQDLAKFQSGCEQGKLWMKPMSPFLTLARCAEGVSSDLTRNQISDQASVYKMFGCSDLNRGNRNIVHHNEPTNVCFFPLFETN